MATNFIPNVKSLKCVVTATLANILLAREIFPLECFQVVPWDIFTAQDQCHESLISSGEPIPQKEPSLFGEESVIYLRQASDNRRCHILLQHLETEVFPYLERQCLTELQACLFASKELHPTLLLECWRLRFEHHLGHGFNIFVHWGSASNTFRTSLPSSYEEGLEFQKLQQFVSSRQAFDEETFFATRLWNDSDPGEDVEPMWLHPRRYQPSWNEWRVAMLRVLDLEVKSPPKAVKRRSSARLAQSRSRQSDALDTSEVRGGALELYNLEAEEPGSPSEPPQGKNSDVSHDGPESLPEYESWEPGGDDVLAANTLPAGSDTSRENGGPLATRLPHDRDDSETSASETQSLCVGHFWNGSSGRCTPNMDESLD